MPLKNHTHVRHPFEHFNASFATKINAWFGSMGTFWVLFWWQIIWIVLASIGIWAFKHDHYPFAFLLFLSNLIQLWALPILGSTTNEADKKRDLMADTQHEALTYLATKSDEHGAALVAIAAKLAISL
jgi:hypothetical protein